jgi:Mlc titration factor MtfA (ptsG expression regulator)
VFRFWRRLSRAEVLKAEFPPEFRRIVRDEVPLSRYLEAADREKLEALVRVFLAEKSFEGAGGLELTDEMRVAIAARACLLILKRKRLDDPIYPDLDSIIVYPSTYRVRQARQEGHVVVEGEELRLGESWQRGMVVLSWDSVQSGSQNPNDGHDVVLHEFAHQLDAEDGGMDGAPDLGESERYRAWAEVLGHEYAELRSRVEHHRRSSIDAYGAVSPPEFFAVVTEAFFEKPLTLARRHPELYAVLSDYFELDPAELVQKDALDDP